MKRFMTKIRVKISDLKFKLRIWLSIKRGYVAKDGTPLKCHKCESTSFFKSDEFYDEHCCVEYSISCMCCGIKLGHWAYGYWEV